MISVRTDATLDVVALRLLGDPVRARIVEHLAVEQLCTCHLVDLLGASQSNVSNHLRALRQAGLVLAEPQGRFTYYRLVPAALAQLGGQLDALRIGAEAASTRRRPCP
ncbi:MAG: metalloregulator ArsR/SmtB family transcription factor [Actinomycetota bacterium]|nr:metalloregulator ArsR/SmtB family transcription factor [Actinomycetota bacterium]